MKNNIHPKYKMLNVKISNDVFQTYSTLDVVELLMDVDFRQHPAWNRTVFNAINYTNSNIDHFKKKYGKLFTK